MLTLRRHDRSILSFKRFVRLAVAMAVAIATAFVTMPLANAATADPTLKLAIVDDIVLVSGRHFEASSTVAVKATIERGSGSTSITANSSGRFLLGFSRPAGFAGLVTISATSGESSVTSTLSVGGDTSSTSTTTTTNVALSTTSTSTTSSTQLATTSTTVTVATTNTSVVAPTTGAKMSIWHHTWGGPSLSAYPEDVKSNLGMVVLAIAQSAGNGAVSYGPSNGDTTAKHAADIRAFEARGIRVLLGFGGAGDTTTITTTAQADNFAASVIALQKIYGFSGVDVDLEPSGTSWNEAALVYGLRKIDKAVGSDFMIGVTPGLYGEHTARWMSLAKTLGSDMDYMAPMLYDFPEAMDSRLTQVTLDKINLMKAAGIPANKIIMGYMTQPSAGYSASPPDGNVIAAAFATAEKQHPGIRAFLWEDKLQQEQGWAAFRKLAPLVNG